MDLADRVAVQQWVAEIPDDRLPHVLVNNAGIYPFADLLETDLEQCERIFDVNTHAPFALMQAFANRWISIGIRGVIVNVSSASAEVARANGSVYGASKAALEQLTRMFAVRLGRHGIRVNAVRPGIADDPDLQRLPPEHMKTIAQRVPLGRTLLQGELADSILFLASEHANFITGQTLSVDGGGSINRRFDISAQQE
jgi:3-oxoacyl-[acyl-carrier protein] reductase